MAQLVVVHTGDYMVELLVPLGQFVLENGPFLNVRDAQFALFLLALALYVIASLPRAGLFPEMHDFLSRYIRRVSHMVQQGGVWSPSRREAVR